MNDKEKIRAEIERMMNNKEIQCNIGGMWILEDLLSFIDSLPEENGRTLFEEIACPGSFGEFVAGLNPPPNESSTQIRWRRIYKDERLPCPAYLWSVSFERYAPYWEGKLIPNIEGCKVGADTWYLPVSDLVSLYKEPE